MSLDDEKFDGLEAGPDLDFIAENIVKAKRKLKKPAPSATDLATAIVGLSINDTIQGSSTLNVSILDEEFKLLDSGFFDSNDDGRIDAIDLNYPDGTGLWWRLTQCNPRSNSRIEMVFMERAAAHLMAHPGPLKVSRAKRTRAEFLKMLCSRVKGQPIIFHSADLTVPQEIGSKKDRKQTKQAKADKDPGITPDPSLKIAGTPASDGQLAQVERALAVARSISAPELAVRAMVCAGIGESGFRAVPNAGGSNYWGVFQGSKDTFEKDDTEGMASAFLKGGRGFQGGGAIALANAHPDMDPGDIATRVEASGQPGNFYGKYLDEAKALIDAGAAGGGFGGTTYRKQYNFEVGTTDKPKENFWDCANRLAAEVKWPFFLDGQDAYFDPETTLIKQKPSLVLQRDDPSVLSWQCDWDGRHIATELRIDLICDAFEFRAGEVFKMVGFGPASSGSTAKLPGRWLISEIDRERSNIFSSFTLKQPEAPAPEPLTEIGTRAGDPAEAGGDITGTPKEIIDNVVLPIARESGIAITANQVEAANARHGPTVDGNRSDHQGPPETAWAADMSNGVSTPEEAKLAQALADKFDIPWTGAGLVTVTHGSYRFQLIHNTNEGGDHFNHVHFGCHVS